MLAPFSARLMARVQRVAEAYNLLSSRDASTQPTGVASNATAQPHTPILPLELIDAVASHADRQTFVALMGTCKAVRQLPSDKALYQLLDPGVNSHFPAIGDSRASIMKKLVGQTKLERNERIVLEHLQSYREVAGSRIAHVFPDGRHLLTYNSYEALQLVDLHGIASDNTYEVAFSFSPRQILSDSFQQHFLTRDASKFELWEFDAPHLHRVATLARRGVNPVDTYFLTPDPRKLEYLPRMAAEPVQLLDLAQTPPRPIIFANGESEFRYLNFSQRGRLITTCSSNSVSVWRNDTSLSGQAALMTYPADAQIDISADERHAVACLFEQGLIEFWSMLDSSSPHRSVRRMNYPLCSLQISPHGNFLAMESQDGLALTLHETASFATHFTPLHVFEHRVDLYRFSADESSFVGPTQSGLCFIDLTVNPPQRYQLLTGSGFGPVSFSVSDDRRFATLCNRNVTTLWNLQTRPPLGFEPIGPLSGEWGGREIHFSPYGNFVSLNKPSCRVRAEVRPAPFAFFRARGDLTEKQVEECRERLKGRFKLLRASLITEDVE